MEDVTIYPWLALRGRTYYLRAPVPADIRDLVAKTEIWKSLRTQERRKAIEALRRESAVINAVFEDHRRKKALQCAPPLEELSAAQLKLVEDVYFAHLLDEDDDLRLSGFEGEDFDEKAEWLEVIDDENRGDFARGRQSAFMLSEAQDVLTWEGIELRLADQSPSWPKLVRAITAATIRAADVKRQRNAGNVIETPKVAPAAPPAAPKATLEDAKLFYITERVSGTEFAQKKRKNRLDAIMRTVKAALGDVPALPDWTVDDAYRVRDYMLGKGTLKPSSVRRELNDLKGIFSLYKDKKARSMDNPFAGLELPKSVGSEKEERLPLPFDILEAARALILDNANPDLKLIWRLLEGTGCRFAEISGLRLEDIVVKGETPHLRIVPHAARRLKNASSQRNVPLVADALDAAKAVIVAAGESPFAFPRYSGQGGPNSASQSLMKWLRKVTTNRLHVVHSLRHNMADRCDLADVNPTDKEAILGHLNKSASEKHYGSESTKLVRTTRAMRQAFAVPIAPSP